MTSTVFGAPVTSNAVARVGDGFDPRTALQMAQPTGKALRAGDGTHNGVSMEKEVNAGGADLSFGRVTFTDGEKSMIKQTGRGSLDVVIERLTIKGKEFSFRMGELVDLAVSRARRRLPKADRFPGTLFEHKNLPIQGVIGNLAQNSEGVSYEVPEVAIRLVMYMSGCTYAEDFDDNFVIPLDNLPEFSERFGSEISSDEKEVLEYLAGLGVSLLIMAVAKPFVDRVVSAVSDMCRNMRNDLRIAEKHLNPTVFADMFMKYLKYMDLPKASQGIVGRVFPGWSWATAYAARFGAGTSHLVCISTFLTRYPNCPALAHIPRVELENYLGALRVVHEDPLALFPLREVADLSLDRYRASAMPSLLIMSTFGLQASGDVNWSRYQNVPYVPTVGDLPVSTFISVVASWVYELHNSTTFAEIVSKKPEFEGFFDELESSAVGYFVQVGGKMKSALQKVAPRT